MTEANQSDGSCRRIAVWIDHRTAVVANFEGERLETESAFHSTAGPHTHGGGRFQHHIQAHNHELLKHFYDEVIQHLRSADEIFILGPGQAKYELCKRIEHRKDLKGKVVGLHHATQISPVELIVMYASALATYRDMEKPRQESLLS
jgi:peptide subunit release factor 1 (eRF1)